MLRGHTADHHWPAVLIALALSCALATGAGAKVKPPAVSLDLAVLADAREPVLAFRVKNVGPLDVVRGELGANTNAIWVLSPDGSVTFMQSIMDPLIPPGGHWRPAVIEPGTQVIWTRTVESLLQGEEQRGVFRLYWDFGGVRSNELRVLHGPDQATRSATQTAQPATAPTRRLATPADAVRHFQRVMNGEGGAEPDAIIGHPNRKLALTIDQWRKVEQAPEDEAAAALYRRANAARRLREAVQQRWGNQALDREWPFTRSDAARVAAAAAEDGSTIEYAEHFLTAVITPAGARRIELGVPPPLRLARDGREWLVAADNFVADGQVDPAIVRTAKVLERAADAVTKGVYASELDAREAVRRELGVTN